MSDTASTSETSPATTCYFCDKPLDGYAESMFKGQTAIVAKCPDGGEYAITPEGVAALDKLTDAERAAVYENLFLNVQFGGSALKISRVFLGGIVERSLLDDDAH